MSSITNNNKRRADKRDRWDGSGFISPKISTSTCSGAIRARYGRGLSRAQGGGTVTTPSDYKAFDAAILALGQMPKAQYDRAVIQQQRMAA